MRFSHPTRGPSARRGMTLVELLVVVGILALLTSVAVTSTDVFLGQGRYEATQKTLAEIGRAVIDDGTQANGNCTGPAGFVADVGRPPASLDELLNPCGIVSHRVREFDSDSDSNHTLDVQLAGGWRGPYVRLAPGQTTLYDGWGRPFGFQQDAAALIVKSRGADGEFDPSQEGYDKDVFLRIEPADWLGSLVVHVRELDANGNEQDPPASEQVVLHLYRVVNGEVVASTPQVETVTFQYRNEALPAGTAAVRALVIEDNVVKKKSPLCYLTIRPHSTWHQKLILRQVQPITPP